MVVEAHAKARKLQGIHIHLFAVKREDMARCTPIVCKHFLGGRQQSIGRGCVLAFCQVVFAQSTQGLLDHCLWCRLVSVQAGLIRPLVCRHVDLPVSWIIQDFRNAGFCFAVLKCLGNRKTRPNTCRGFHGCLTLHCEVVRIPFNAGYRFFAACHRGSGIQLSIMAGKICRLEKGEVFWAAGGTLVQTYPT